MIRALSLIIILPQTGFGQSAGIVAQFEVADVRASKSTSVDPGKARIISGRIDVTNITLKNLIITAYGVQENTIAGGPGWIDSDLFDIVAKAAPDTPPATLRLMLQPLLAERFHLVVHREEKPMPVYAMVVGKGSAKLQPTAGGPSTCRWNNPGSGLIQRECHNMTMEELADSMPKWGMVNRIDLPVIDSTGIKGAHDFHLEWSLPSSSGETSKGEDAHASDPGGATLFDALSRIGLKLEQRKYPVPVIVIDRVDRLPIEN